MYLAPEIQRWIARSQQLTAEVPWPLDDLSALRGSARVLADRLFAEFGKPGPSLHTEEHQVPWGTKTVRVREYLPPHQTLGAHTAILAFHGGGFWAGSIDEDISDAQARDMAAATGMPVYAVAYPLAPEHPAPAAVLAGFECLRWLRARHETRGHDPAGVVLSGNSAGASIAAAIAHRARDGGWGLRGQLLEVPALDVASDLALAEDLEIGFGAEEAERCARWYRGEADGTDPLASPLRQRELRGVATAHIMTAEWDPLRVQGERYVERLLRAGVAATGSRGLGHVHGSPGLTARFAGAHAWRREKIAQLRAWGEEGQGAR